MGMGEEASSRPCPVRDDAEDQNTQVEKSVGLCVSTLALKFMGGMIKTMAHE